MGYVRGINQIILSFDPSFLEHPSAPLNLSDSGWGNNDSPRGRHATTPALPGTISDLRSGNYCSPAVTWGSEEKKRCEVFLPFFFLGPPVSKKKTGFYFFLAGGEVKTEF